jgi:hypothetical protein
MVDEKVVSKPLGYASFEGKYKGDDREGTETDHISDFRAEAGGQRLEVEWMRGGDYYGYYTFTVDFAPHQEIVVTNTYIHRMNRVYNFNNDLCMGYILETGAPGYGSGEG